MNIRDVNLAHLYKSHLIELGGSNGLHLLEQMRNGEIKLGIALTVNGFRNNIDALLRFYGIVEVASIISFIPEPDESEFWRDTVRNLKMPELMAYYENASILPRFLRLRLENTLSLKEDSLEDTANVFLSFLSMVKQFRKDNEIALFLQLLFSPEKRIYGTQLGSLRVLLRNNKEVIERAIKPQGECEPIDWALHGFEKFLQFCADFDKLLQDCETRPLMQSAMWACCIDVFETAAKNIRDIVEESSGIFETWGDNSIKEAATYRKEVVTLTERLTSGKYKEYLAAQVHPGKYDLHKRQEVTPHFYAGQQIITRIYVGNFAFNMTDPELRSLFEPFGAVESTVIVRDRDTGRSRGFGFVSMFNHDEAERAIKALNGKEWGGRALTVAEARPRPDTRREFRRRERQDEYRPYPRPPRDIN